MYANSKLNFNALNRLNNTNRQSTCKIWGLVVFLVFPSPESFFPRERTTYVRNLIDFSKYKVYLCNKHPKEYKSSIIKNW